MITPQNTIQSTDQTPVAAPSPYAARVSPNGAPQTATPRMIVTTEPMITACHADIRSTASRKSSTATGTSASSVSPATEPSGSRTWLNMAPPGGTFRDVSPADRTIGTSVLQTSAPVYLCVLTVTELGTPRRTAQ